MPTRRDFLKWLGVFVAGTALGLAIGSSRNLYSLVKEYQQKEKTYTATETKEEIIPENQTETITVTVTKTLTNTQVPKTYTITNTTTISETETITETITTTETITETLTTTSPTSTTTQPSQNLEQILFGNSNLQFIPLEVLDVQLNNNTAYLTVWDDYTQTELQLEAPIKYLSKGNITIGDLFSTVKNYNSTYGTNYQLYLVLGRTNVNEAIQQNGKWILPASQIYYNIIISDKNDKDIYDSLQKVMNGNAAVLMPILQSGPYANSLWGWSNQPINGYNNIIILYQNGQQVNSVTNYIKLADYILGELGNKNPTQSGILHVDTIANIDIAGTYQNSAAVVEVNNYLGTYIVFVQQKGNLLVPTL
jgi:hypothetical protein